MGHCIHYNEYPERTDPHVFINDAYELARRDGDSGYHGNLQIHNIRFDSREEAEDAIDGLDTGYYSDHAVKFLDYSKCAPTKTMQEITKRIDKLHEQRTKYLDEHSVMKQKAKLITCRNCESKISREWLKTEYCPVCRNDLRADYIKERLKEFDKKENELRKQYGTAEKKLKSKAQTKWLVKIEFHC